MPTYTHNIYDEDGLLDTIAVEAEDALDGILKASQQARETWDDRRIMISIRNHEGEPLPKLPLEE